MKPNRSLLKLLAVCAAVCLAPAANAQLFRTYLKSTGNDANPCTAQQPCRLLPAALSAVASGGEIWILDSANFNTATVNINKSVTVLAIPGATGSVVATGGAPAISIATAGVQVALRNLVIVPFGSGTSGITMTAGNSLSVERCQIFGLTAGSGIHVSTGARVKVTDSILRGNNHGVLAENTAAVDIANSKIVGNASHGVFVNAITPGITTATVSDSVVSDNSVGARAFSSVSGASARLYVNRLTVATNATSGLASEAAGSGVALLSVGDTAIDRNGTGILQSGAGAKVNTLGTNYIGNNGADITGVLTPLAQR